MIPVEQTRYGFPDGNCFAACVASILELPLSDTDIISAAADDWWGTWQAWLAERNLQMIHWPIVEGSLVPRGWAILGTKPPHLADAPGIPPEWQGRVGHSVVAHNGEPAHNPNPTFTDLGPWESWTVFAVLDPALPSGLERIEKALDAEFYIDEYTYHDAPSASSIIYDVMQIIRRVAGREVTP